jgi:hypothetical protein
MFLHLIIYPTLLCLIVASFSSVLRIRIRNGSRFYQAGGSGFGFRIQEGKGGQSKLQFLIKKILNIYQL